MPKQSRGTAHTLPKRSGTGSRRGQQESSRGGGGQRKGRSQRPAGEQGSLRLATREKGRGEAPIEWVPGLLPAHQVVFGQFF